MNPKELYSMLKTLGIPVAYFKFDDPPTLPFMVWLQTGVGKFMADQTVWTKEKSYAIEYYFEFKNPDLEERIEDLLTSSEISWERTEDVYIPEERLFMTTYYIN